jgi:L-threonylcarbamoyladenylate synthase
MDFREDINNAVKVLREGGIILYPTDTIWGIGCDATNEDAVRRIFEIKKRSDSKSLIILVNSTTMLERYVSYVPKSASEITDISEKPVTIIYPRGRNLAKGVCSEDGSVGIRITSDEFCSELITRFRKPVVSTSANFSDLPSPKNFSGIENEIILSVSYVVKYRQDDTAEGKPSPVIKVNGDGTIQIIRK